MECLPGVVSGLNIHRWLQGADPEHISSMVTGSISHGGSSAASGLLSASGGSNNNVFRLAFLPVICLFGRQHDPSTSDRTVDCVSIL